MGGHQAHPADRPRRADSPGRELIATRALALDLDGTLIDARRRQVGVAAEALAELTGQRLRARSFWAAKREGATTFEALRGLGLTAEVAGDVAARWSERIECEDWLAHDRALPGVKSALRALREQAYRATVLTARRRPAGARRSLAVAGLEPWVDELVVVDPTVSAQAKAKALGELGAGGFVGDTESDGTAAALAGVDFIAVSTGQRSAAYLRARTFEVAGSLPLALTRLGVEPSWA